MAVTAIGDYPVLPRDGVENFHGNQLVAVGWDHHLMIDAPMAFPLPAGMPFAALVGEVIPVAYSPHPEWEKIDWEAVTWTLDGEAFVPNMEASLEENGIGHKSVIRFVTPGLDGLWG